MDDLRFLDPESFVNREAFNKRFGALNMLFQHWWSKNIAEHFGYKLGTYDRRTLLYRAPKGETAQVLYSDKISIDSKGVVSLVNPYQITVSYNNSADAGFLVGKFFEAYDSNSSSTNNSKRTIYKASDTNTVSIYQETSGFQWVYFGGYQIDTYIVPENFIEYLQSANPDEYPKGGTLDGYMYKYLGIPLFNAATAVQIATGSYVGTGTYGESNPNSLTFEFEPKLVIISGISSNGAIRSFAIISSKGSGFGTRANVSYSTTPSPKVIFSDIKYNNLKWFVGANSSSDATATLEVQQNVSGTTYHYLAIG